MVFLNPNLIRKYHKYLIIDLLKNGKARPQGFIKFYPYDFTE